MICSESSCFLQAHASYLGWAGRASVPAREERDIQDIFGAGLRARLMAGDISASIWGGPPCLPDKREIQAAY